MQKMLRILILLLLIVVLAAIVYTQVRIFVSHPHGTTIQKSETDEQQAVADLAASKAPANNAATPAPASAPAAPAVAAPAIGTEAMPMVVKVLPQPVSEVEASGRVKDREILQGIGRNMSKIAATALAQNFLLLFLAIIYFLVLMLLGLLMESVKKSADAAAKSAEAAKKSAEVMALMLRKIEAQAALKSAPTMYRKR